MRRGGCGKILGRALQYHAAAAVAALGSEVDDPVGLRHDVEVVLDHQHRVAGVDQAMQHADQLLDIGHVQADGRLVEDVERVRLGAHLGELGDELDALRFAAGQRRALLAEREVAEADVLQQLQCMVGRGMRREELDGLVDTHRQDLGDRSLAKPDCERLVVEAAPAADVA